MLFPAKKGHFSHKFGLTSFVHQVAKSPATGGLAEEILHHDFVLFPRIHQTLNTILSHQTMSFIGGLLIFSTVHRIVFRLMASLFSLLGSNTEQLQTSDKKFLVVYPKVSFALFLMFVLGHIVSSRGSAWLAARAISGPVARPRWRRDPRRWVASPAPVVRPVRGSGTRYRSLVRRLVGRR